MAYLNQHVAQYGVLDPSHQETRENGAAGHSKVDSDNEEDQRSGFVEVHLQGRIGHKKVRQVQDLVMSLYN